MSNSAQGRAESHDFGNLSIKSQAFTPSYKKSSSCSDPPDSYQSLEVVCSANKKIEELDIDNLSQINV